MSSAFLKRVKRLETIRKDKVGKMTLAQKCPEMCAVFKTMDLQSLRLLEKDIMECFEDDKFIPGCKPGSIFAAVDYVLMQNRENGMPLDLSPEVLARLQNEGIIGPTP